jgi:hypothetical protein
MPAQWQPLVQLPVMDQQNLPLMNNKYRHRKINLLMNMRHASDYNDLQSKPAI